MSYEEFSHTLKRLGLSREEFAKRVNMNYNSVANWKQSGEVAGWVESWLNLYEQAQKYQAIKKLISSHL